MSNDACYPILEQIKTIVDAMEIVYARRLLEKMEAAAKFPLPPPQKASSAAVPLDKITTELNALHDCKTLRFKYERRVHVDPDMEKELDEFVEKAGDFLDRMART